MVINFCLRILHNQQFFSPLGRTFFMMLHKGPKGMQGENGITNARVFCKPKESMVCEIMNESKKKF